MQRLSRPSTILGGAAVRSSNGRVASTLFFAVGLVALGVGPIAVRAETTVGVQVGTGNFEFGFLYNDYYRVEPRVVQRCTATLSEPDVVVALHLARASGVDLDVILDWRRHGISWFDIGHRCRVGPEFYYVELPSDPGPPYGRAWGYWRRHPRQELRLSDDEVRGFVTLRAISDYSDLSVTDVLRLRREGYTPARIVEAGKKTRSSPAAAKVGGKTEDTAPGRNGNAGHGKSAPPGHGKSKGKGGH